MSLYTSSYLKKLSSEKISSLKERLFSEGRSNTYFDIFLSHSFLDKEEVEGIYIELTNLGFSVYVDWIIDPHLNRNNVTKQTAEHIRTRMKASKSLLLAISTNAAMSKWMPWELGYIDGKTNQCAIFPVSKELSAPKTFHRSEYLLLYPYIKKANISIREELFVMDSANMYVPFSGWLKRNAKPEYNYTNIEML